MSNDTRLETIDCPHDECENEQTVLVPRGAMVIGTSERNEERSQATGKVRAQCDDHEFYVYFSE